MSKKIAHEYVGDGVVVTLEIEDDTHSVRVHGLESDPLVRPDAPL
jgi:hypothetical protein